MLHFQQAPAAQAIGVLLRDIMLLILCKIYTITLAFGNVTDFALKEGAATWAGFGFVLRHMAKIPI